MGIPKPIVMKCCTEYRYLDSYGVINYSDFGVDRLKGSGMAGVKFSMSPLTCADAHALSHSLALP